MEMTAHLAVLLELLLFLVFLRSTSSSAQKEMKEETEQMISVDLIIFLSKQILFLVFHKAQQIAARPTNKWNFPAKGM